MDISTLVMITWAVCACIVALLAARNNRNMWLWFVAALLLTPILALVAVLWIGKKAGAEQQSAFLCRFSKEPKPCTFCHRCGLSPAEAVGDSSQT